MYQFLEPCLLCILSSLQIINDWPLILPPPPFVVFFFFFFFFFVSSTIIIAIIKHFTTEQQPSTYPLGPLHSTTITPASTTPESGIIPPTRTGRSTIFNLFESRVTLPLHLPPPPPPPDHIDRCCPILNSTREFRRHASNFILTSKCHCSSHIHTLSHTYMYQNDRGLALSPFI